MQFDLQIDIDREALKATVLKKLWDAFYGDQPAPVGNPFGAVIKGVRDVFPKLTRQAFNMKFGEAIDKGLAAGERTLPEVLEQVRDLVADTKIPCLTESPDSTTMWAYYAEQHQGVVLQFRSVPELDSPWGVARPVQYLAHMPRLLDNAFLADMLSGRISMDVGSIMDRMIYTKSSEWAHEREWRICSGVGRDPKAPHENIPFNSLELEAVIVGCRMPEEDRAEFSDLTRRLYPQAQLLKTEKAERKFQIQIKPLENAPNEKHI